MNWTLVRWLALGSIPSAFGGVFVLRALGGDHFENKLKIILGVVLIVAATSIVVKSYLQGHAAERMRRHGLEHEPFPIKPIPTLIIGIIGGLVVGMTSVGSGSLIIVALLLLYPMLTAKELVGTDLVQADPPRGRGGVRPHPLRRLPARPDDLDPDREPAGRVHRRAPVLRAPDGLIRPALVFVLVASGLKLTGLPTLTLGYILVGMIVVGLPVWGAVDAARKHGDRWDGGERSRTRWVRLQSFGAVVGVGFVASIVYFARIRPRLVPSRAAAVPAAA